MRILLEISYNGKNYSGWQKQQNTSKSIQENIESAIFKVTGEQVCLYASGRTDAGVHAKQQFAHFDLNRIFEVNKIAKAINAYLPDDIVIVSAKKVSDTFNARFDVKKKQYVYSIYQSDTKDVFIDDYSLQIKKPVNIQSMVMASKYLLGTHDFSSFCSKKTGVKDFERTIFSIKIKSIKNTIKIYVCGNGFLYNMVRIIVGTLLEIGEGKREIDNINQILLAKDRQVAGKTAPAKGLMLDFVKY